MPDFREEVKAETILHTTSTTSSLSSVTPSNEGLDEPAELALLVKSHLSVFASIDHACDVRYGDA
jgi:hypothetical protein